MHLFQSLEFANPKAVWGPDTSTSADSWYSDKVQSVIQAIAIRKEELGPTFTILDMACGNGILDAEFSAAFPEARIVGVDLEPYPEWKDRTSDRLTFEVGEMFTFLQTDTRDWDITLMLNILRIKSPYPDQLALAWAVITKWCNAHTKYLLFDYWPVNDNRALSRGFAYHRSELGDLHLFEYKGRKYEERT